MPHLEFDAARVVENASLVNPGTALPVSARTGEGLEAWYRWIRQQARSSREAALQP